MVTTRQRLDHALVSRGITKTRSQAESYVKLGHVRVNNRIITKPGYRINAEDAVSLDIQKQYVSRAALKLDSVSQALHISFTNKLVLDVGSSTGGFTDYALRHGAKKVIAVDVGTDQLHHSLRSDPRIELHEKTDIRNLRINKRVDIVVIDVSFISLRQVLPAVAKLSSKTTQIIAMAKPQFEAGSESKHKGVIKNQKMRRNTLENLENWIKKLFKVIDKADSEVHGFHGNQERFYLLKPL